VGGEVERLGGVAEQDQRAAVGLGADEAQDVVGDVLEAVGRQLGEVVPSAVDVRVGVLEEVLLGVEHRPGGVGAGAVVQVDERPRLALAGDLEALACDRELVADGLDVEHVAPPREDTASRRRSR
jgi:hypothetical protein